MSEEPRIFQLVCEGCNIVVKEIECPDAATEAVVWLRGPLERCTLCGQWPTLRLVVPPAECEGR